MDTSNKQTVKAAGNAPRSKVGEVIEEIGVERTARVIRKQRDTIRQLVEMVDLLRQPYNNSKRHDLYEWATETLNRLDESGLLR